MKPKLIAIVLTLGLAAAAGFAVTRMASNPGVPADAAHIVKLSGDKADPSVLAIQKGEYIQFATKDGKTHDIGQGKGDNEIHQQTHQDEHDHLKGGKESGAFGPGQAWRVQFKETGTYDFHDHLNPKISVTVVVYERSSQK